MRWTRLATTSIVVAVGKSRPDGPDLVCSALAGIAACPHFRDAVSARARRHAVRPEVRGSRLTDTPMGYMLCYEPWHDRGGDDDHHNERP